MLMPRARLRGAGDLRNATPISSAAKVVMTVEVSIHARSPAYALWVSNGHLPSNHMTTSSVENISWTIKGADHVAVRQARASSAGARLNEASEWLSCQWKITPGLLPVDRRRHETLLEVRDLGRPAALQCVVDLPRVPARDMISAPLLMYRRCTAPSRRFTLLFARNATDASLRVNSPLMTCEAPHRGFSLTAD
jgi:hypothetical protein